jgi:hypothetical protein
MEQCRCAFGRYRASSGYSRRPSVHLGLDSINLGCAWSSITRRNRPNKSDSTKKHSLWTNEKGHQMSSLRLLESNYGVCQKGNAIRILFSESKSLGLSR